MLCGDGMHVPPAISPKASDLVPKEREGGGVYFCFVAFENFLHTGEAIKFPDSTDIECNRFCYRTIHTSILPEVHRGLYTEFNVQYAVLTNWPEFESDRTLASFATKR